MEKKAFLVIIDAEVQVETGRKCAEAPHCPGGPDHHVSCCFLSKLVKTSKVCDRPGAVRATGEPARRCAGVPAVHHLCSQPGSVFWLPLRSELNHLHCEHISGM